jgi:hypothetical protein
MFCFILLLLGRFSNITGNVCNNEGNICIYT